MEEHKIQQFDPQDDNAILDALIDLTEKSKRNYKIFEKPA